MSGIQETFEALGHFLYKELLMKEYKTNEELINFLSSGVIVANREVALQKNGGTMLEELPTPKKSLKQLEKENRKSLKKKYV